MLHLKRSRSEALDDAAGPSPPPVPTPRVPDDAADAPADSPACELVPLGTLPASALPAAAPRRVAVDAAAGRALLAAGGVLLVCALPPAAEADSAALALPAGTNTDAATDAEGAVDRVALFARRGGGDTLGALACTRAGQIRVWADLAPGDAVVRAACDRGTFFLATQAARVHRVHLRPDDSFAVLPTVPLPVAPAPAASPAAAAPSTQSGGLFSLLSYIPFFRSSSSSSSSSSNSNTGNNNSNSSNSSSGEACGVPQVLVAVPARQVAPLAGAETAEAACFVLTAGTELWRVDGTGAHGTLQHVALADAVRTCLAAEGAAPPAAPRDVVCCALFATAPQQCFVLAAVAEPGAGPHHRAYVVQVEAETDPEAETETDLEEETGVGALTVVRVVRLGDAVLPGVRGVALAVTRTYNAFHAHVVARTRVVVGTFALGIAAVGALAPAHDVAVLAATDACLAAGLDRAGHAVVVTPSAVLGVHGPGLGATAAAMEDDEESDEKKDKKEDVDAALEEVYRRFGQPGILNSVAEREEINAALGALAARGPVLDAAVLRMAHRIADKRPEVDLGATIAAAVPAAAAAAVPAMASAAAPMVTMTHLEQKRRKYATLRALVAHAYAPGARLAACLAPGTCTALGALGEWLAAACALRRVLADANERRTDNALAACVRAHVRAPEHAGTHLFADVSRLAAFVPALARALEDAAGAQDRAALVVTADALDALTAPLSARTLQHAGPALADALARATTALARSLAAPAPAAAAAPEAASEEADFAVRVRPVLERLVRQTLVALRPCDDDAAATPDALLADAAYQARAAPALDALLTAGLVARAHALALEFAVAAPLIAACERLGDSGEDKDDDAVADEALRAAMAQLGDRFARAVFAHWDAGRGPQRQKLFGGDGAQQAAAAAYLAETHSADLHLALLRLHRYDAAARELCVRAEAARDKARRCELASLGRMAAALAADPAAVAPWRARLACALQDVATQNLDPALRAQAACATPHATVAALAATGDAARVAAAADLVHALRACGRCGRADAAALAEELWRGVLQRTPWRRLARLAAEGRLADTRLEAAIRGTPFCVCAQHVLAQLQRQEGCSDAAEETRAAIAGALDFYRGCVQPVSDQLESILATLLSLATTVLDGAEGTEMSA